MKKKSATLCNKVKDIGVYKWVYKEIFHTTITRLKNENIFFHRR